MFKEIKTAELTGAALDWAVAKCEGMTHPEPKPMTELEAEKMRVPFYLWGTVSNKDKEGNWFTTVEKIEVVRYGVDASVGATLPSISFIDSAGVLCRGSVGMFFKTEAEAHASILYEACDYQWDEGGYSPSSDWSQCGPIIEREGLCLIKTGTAWQCTTNGNELHSHAKEAPEPLIAALRCYVASKLGDTVSIPVELLEVK